MGYSLALQIWLVLGVKSVVWITEIELAVTYRPHPKHRLVVLRLWRELILMRRYHGRIDIVLAVNTLSVTNVASVEKSVVLILSFGG